MIRLEANNWYDAWLGLHSLFAKDPDSVIDQRFATRAVSFTNTITVKNNDLAGLSHTMVGYTSYKLNKFDRQYIIPGLKEDIGQKLLDRIQSHRKLTILSYSFDIHNQAHDQGPCLINIVITLWRKGNRWKIKFEPHMRIGEITHRKLVDFVKFHELVNYWMDLLSEYDPELVEIQVRASALYAEPISLTIAHYIFDDAVKFELDHWLHNATRSKIADYDTKELRFKRGRRIKKYVQTLQKGN